MFFSVDVEYPFEKYGDSYSVDLFGGFDFGKELEATKFEATSKSLVPQKQFDFNSSIQVPDTNEVQEQIDLSSDALGLQSSKSKRQAENTY